MTKNRDQILERADTAKTLPMLTGMMNEVFKVISNPDSSHEQLYRIVKYDQAISSKIISIANSTFYGRGAAVTSLERAMILIGFREIERIIMCLVFMKQIMAPWRLTREDVTEVWAHSLTVAHAAKALGARRGAEESEEAFATAIVHDIGKIVFYAHDEHYRNLTKEARAACLDVCELERAEYDVDHQEAGYRMSVRWGFPKHFSEAILTHHGRWDGKTASFDDLRMADAYSLGADETLPEEERKILEAEKQLIEEETERIRQLVGM